MTKPQNLFYCMVFAIGIGALSACSNTAALDTKQSKFAPAYQHGAVVCPVGQAYVGRHLDNGQPINRERCRDVSSEFRDVILDVERAMNAAQAEGVKKAEDKVFIRYLLRLSNMCERVHRIPSRWHKVECLFVPKRFFESELDFIGMYHIAAKELMMETAPKTTSILRQKLPVGTEMKVALPAMSLSGFNCKKASNPIRCDISSDAISVRNGLLNGLGSVGWAIILEQDQNDKLQELHVRVTAAHL